MRRLRLGWRKHWQIGKRRAARWVTGSETGVLCAETTTAVVLLVSAVVAAAASAAGTAMAVSAQKKQAKAAAMAAEVEGEMKATQHREEVRRAAASFGSRAGAAGVVGGVGSPLLAELELVRLGEVEAERRQFSDEYRAKLLNWQAGTYSPGMAAGLSLLGSSGTIATSYYGGRGMA